MKLNKTQKIILITGLLLITAAFLIWVVSGAEIFTKTQVLIESHDILLGRTYNEWQDKFILGLDYTLAFTVFVSFITAGTVYLTRNKK